MNVRHLSNIRHLPSLDDPDDLDELADLEEEKMLSVADMMCARCPALLQTAMLHPSQRALACVGVRQTSVLTFSVRSGLAAHAQLAHQVARPD